MKPTWFSIVVAMATLSIPQALHSAFRGDGHINLVNLHLGEAVDVQYRQTNGNYNFTALDEVNKTLRCRMTHQVHEIPSALIEVIDEIQDHFDVDHIDVISGYRSPLLNSHLKSLGRKVATYSLHMEGLAIDIRVPGVSTKEVRDYAKFLRKGGVGYYPGNNFVHVDLGRVRYW